MSNRTTLAIGAVDPQEVLLIEFIIVERVSVADTETRFQAALDKRDKLGDDDSSAPTARIRDRAFVEVARLNNARQRLAAATENLRVFSVAKFGATPRSAKPKDKEDAPVEKDKKQLKRKLLALKDGWLDQKGIIIYLFTDRHRLFQYLSNMF